MTAEKRFNEFYKRMFSSAFTKAYFITKDKVGAEDVVVKAMLSVWRKWGSFENDSKAGAYLNLSVQTEAFMYLEKSKTRKKYYALIAETIDIIFEPYHSDYEENIKKLKAVLPYLPSHYQELVNLILAGHKDRYIAQSLKTNHLRKLKYNVIQRIKQLLYDTQNT